MSEAKLSSAPSHEQLANYLRSGVEGDVESISIIGSYLIDLCVRPGSDIDTVVVVNDLEEAEVQFDGDIFYKNTIVEDSQGRRQELNTKLEGVPIDVTVIDPESTNPPNNPLTDYYENFLGLCESGYPIYGDSLKEVLKYDEKVAHYDAIRNQRLELVDEKLKLTKDKILEQGRNDLHIIYELQRYTFIRECIARRIFNKWSIKHPERSIPDFNEVFHRQLGQCGLALTIANIEPTTDLLQE